MHRHIVKLAIVWLCAVHIGLAQEFKLWSHPVQVHGFASQGFVYSDENNWLTMNTNQGSGAMTDMGLNISSQITDRFRVGAQVYDRNLGQLGQWHPSLDWAVADYRFATWWGIRAGKVKTTLGLYNDTQDLDFMHTFALLPQGVYPTDLRDTTIAHKGGDVYGDIAFPHGLGGVSYTAYAGHRSDSIYSGYPYLLTQFGVHLRSYGGLQYGADLRWNTPLRGLLVGASRMNEEINGHGSVAEVPGSGPGTLVSSSKADWTNQFYGEYKRGKLHAASEYRRYLRDQLIPGESSEVITDMRAWYFSGDYRIAKKLRLGSYYSHYTATKVYGGALAAQRPNQTDTSQPINHIYDKVITVRVDLNRFWDVKVEGHFINGYASSQYPDGFYPQQNPHGFRPNTSALVLKTGVSF